MYKVSGVVVAEIYNINIKDVSVNEYIRRHLTVTDRE